MVQSWLALTALISLISTIRAFELESSNSQLHVHNFKARPVNVELAVNHHPGPETHAQSHHLINPGIVRNASYVQSDLITGRYGHGSVFIPGSNRVLFIGGQIDHDGALITNDVSYLDLSQEFDSFDQYPHPMREEYTQNLPALAWAATTIDFRGRIWSLGGTTQDPTHDRICLVSSDAGKGWSNRDGDWHEPPRRRQSQAVSIPTEIDGTTIFNWGGIAGPSTGSPDTVGYYAMDVWHANDNHVDMVQYTHPHGAPEHYHPPVADYAAAALPDGRIVYIGGQTAQGDLLPFDTVLVYHPDQALWFMRVSFSFNFL